MESLIRIEGVNFAQTVDYLNDLSAYRGASLALEATVAVIHATVTDCAGGCERARKIYTGGSQYLALLTDCDKAAADQICADIRQQLDAGVTMDGLAEGLLIPSGEMCWVVDHAPVENGDIPAAANAATLRSRLRQMRAPSFPALVTTTVPSDASVSERLAKLCPIDPTRPTDPGAAIWTAPGRFSGVILDTRPPPPARPKAEKIAVSTRSEALRTFGRTSRSSFYGQQPILNQPEYKAFTFADQFQDLVEAPPDGLSESAESKMAVFYVDGAGFGALRHQMVKDNGGTGLTQFADFVRDLFFDHLLAGILAQFCHGQAQEFQRYALLDARTGDSGTESLQKLRFETLFLGGEDWCFVAPGWLANELIETLMAALERFNLRPNCDAAPDARLRIGCLICPVKMPIRRARTLAKELCEKARPALAASDNASAVDMEVIESVDIPDDQLDNYRARRFEGATPDMFGYAQNEWIENGRIWRLMSEFPRSQFYKLIRAVDGLSDAAAEDAAALAIKRSEEGRRVMQELAAISNDQDLGGALQGHGDLAFKLKRLADFWDYVAAQPAPNIADETKP